MSKFMAKKTVAALFLGVIAALPSCGCKKEETVVIQPPVEMPKAIDAVEAQVEAAMEPAAESAQVLPVAEDVK